MREQRFCCEAVKDGLKIEINEPVHCVKEDLTKFVLNFFELESIVTGKQLFESILCEIPISTVILTKESLDDWIFNIKRQKKHTERKEVVNINILSSITIDQNQLAIPA